MKRILIVLTICFVSLVSSAHKINGYKYLHIQESGNLYGVEERLTEYFQKIGFQTIASYDYEDMSSENKSKLLIATYNWNIVYGGHSTLLLTLSDVTGSVIYRVSGEGISFSAKGDMKNALKKIFKKMDELHYSYDPEANKIKGGSEISSNYATWSEDSIKSYLRTKNPSMLEGIYKNYSNNLDYYKIAILKDKDGYCGIILETENKRWSKGETKLKLNSIEKNTYDVEYFDFKGKKLNSIGKLDNRILSFTIDRDGQNQNIQFLKIFPIKASNSTEGSAIGDDTAVKATGSGFVVSGNIIATNYHVIDGAEKIKVVLNINGSPEEYATKVLSTDKTNDIALLTIKDAKFKPFASVPYTIQSNTSDVGTSVFTMGYPLSSTLGKEVKITDGLISSKTGYEGDAVTYQISAPIQPGNSGGALFDKKGHLIGITNAGIPSAENVGYAIKSSYLLNLIDSAPIDIQLPKGVNLVGKDLPDIIKIFTPYVAFIKIY